MAAGLSGPEQGMGPVLVCLDMRSCHHIVLWVSKENNSNKLEMGNFITLLEMRSVI